MRHIERVASWLCVGGAVVGGVAMMAMMLQVGLDVICKYLFNYPIQFTLEMVSTYYMVAIVFLPLGLVTRDGGHVVVELFTQGFGARSLALIDALAGLLGIAYVGMMTVRSYEVAVEKTAIRESWEAATTDIEVWPARWLLVIGCALMTLYLCVRVIDKLRFYRSGTRLTDRIDGAGL